MKGILKSLAAVGLVMVAGTGSARPLLPVDYVIYFYDNEELTGEQVGQRIQYCNGTSGGWGTQTLYHEIEYFNECD